MVFNVRIRIGFRVRGLVLEGKRLVYNYVIDVLTKLEVQECVSVVIYSKCRPCQCYFTIL